MSCDVGEVTESWRMSSAHIPSKTTTLVPDFVVEDLPLGITSALVPEFALGQHSDDIYIFIYSNHE